MLNFGSLRTELGCFCSFACFPGSRSGAVKPMLVIYVPTFLPSASCPCYRPRMHICGQLPRHLLHTLFPQIDQSRSRDLGMHLDHIQVLPLVSFGPHCKSICGVRCSKLAEKATHATHAITSADGPSRAGPISERVVKPEALRGILALLTRI
jgi:hypothetical protein